MGETIPKKSLGQHWLSDQSALKAMVESALVHKNDTVLEIGPGMGTLTDELLNAGAKVLALEFDHELVQKLQKKYKGDEQIEIREGDIRRFDFGSMSKGYKVVANIPYYLTANLLRALIDSQNKPAIASLLVQKEVAERIAAKPGQLSFISVATQVFYDVVLSDLVPAHLFDPPPKVDSQILILVNRGQPLFDNLDTKVFFKLLKAGFDQKRKKIKTSLAGGLGVGKGEAAKLLAMGNIHSDLRPQELTLEQWHKLYSAYLTSL